MIAVLKIVTRTEQLFSGTPNQQLLTVLYVCFNCYRYAGVSYTDVSVLLDIRSKYLGFG